jgi:hypothetical protein
MRRCFLVAATVAFLGHAPAFYSQALAQQAEAPLPFSAEDTGAFVDARIAALKAGLKLTPEQEKYWPALDAALREAAKTRADRGAGWREKAKDLRDKDEVIESLRLHAKDLQARGFEMEKVADAAKPLFESLNKAQKRRFGILLRAIAGPGFSKQ